MYSNNWNSVAFAISIDSTLSAAEKCTDEDIAEMEKSITKRIEAFQNNDIESAIYWGSHFHEVIVAAVGNRFLTAIYKSLRKELYRDRVSYIQRVGFTESVEGYVEEDRRLLEAFKKHDSKLAQELMKEHIEILVHSFREN